MPPAACWTTPATFAACHEGYAGMMAIRIGASRSHFPELAGVFRAASVEYQRLLIFQFAPEH